MDPISPTTVFSGAEALQARMRGLQLQAEARLRPARQDAGGFAALMTSSVRNVDSALHEAASRTEAFLREEPGADLVGTMMAVNKARVTFRTMVEIRNQLIQAYKDVANMPV